MKAGKKKLNQRKNQAKVKKANKSIKDEDTLKISPIKIGSKKNGKKV